jgi:hypothetical protein
MVEVGHDDDLGTSGTSPRHLDRDRAIAAARVVTLIDGRREPRLARGIERARQR